MGVTRGQRKLQGGTDVEQEGEAEELPLGETGRGYGWTTAGKGGVAGGGGQGAEGAGRGLGDVARARPELSVVVT